MNWQELRACVVKELRLLGRDVHGLALLFVMPAAFILVMSLALKDQFEARGGKKIEVLLTDRDQSDASQKLIARLNAADAFALSESASRAKFALTIESGFGAQLTNPSSAAAPTVTLEVAADAAKQTQMIVVAAIREALGRQGIDEAFNALRTLMQPLAQAQGQTMPEANSDDSRLFRVLYRFGESQSGAPPSAVQQNVPAWLVFAMFFVVIPVSNAVIRERQVGTLRRIRTTRVSNVTLLLGKLIPYFVVNQLQVIAMLLIGIFLVPKLGGDALSINGSLVGLAAISASVSIAALGYALLIAVVAKTTEQATIIGGAGNIILAAIGGIMVPKFVMPAAMQNLASFSPMSWGLEGFLDVLLRGGHVQSALPECLGLIALGIAALILAGFVQSRARD
jgi:ABC-2 type transport system permease protein